MKFGAVFLPEKSAKENIYDAVTIYQRQIESKILFIVLGSLTKIETIVQSSRSKRNCRRDNFGLNLLNTE